MARARSLGAELRFPRAAARSRQRRSGLWPSHRPPSQSRKRVYTLFPPCLAFVPDVLDLVPGTRQVSDLQLTGDKTAALLAFRMRGVFKPRKRRRCRSKAAVVTVARPVGSAT